MAWLHAAPENVGNEKKDRKPRIESLPIDAIERSMPECEDCEYLINAFIASGMALSSGMGISRLTWSELSAYNEVAMLERWELNVLMQMSRAYCSMMHKAEKRIPPPYTREMDESDRQWLSREQSKAFDMLEAQTSSIKIKPR